VEQLLLISGRTVGRHESSLPLNLISELKVDKKRDSKSEKCYFESYLFCLYYL
jgi:hypothetical protein